MIKKAFTAFDKIDERTHDDIVEISVKQSQLVFSFLDQRLVQMVDIKTLDQIQNVSDVTCYNDELFIAMRDLDESIALSNDYIRPLYDIILVLKDLVCQCPNLEYVISHDYIKVYLDVPNIQLSSLSQLTDVLQQDPFIEFGADRPFLLFVNENSYGDSLNE